MKSATLLCSIAAIVVNEVLAFSATTARNGNVRVPAISTDQQRAYRKAAHGIASEFSSVPFVTSVTNPHFQTIAGLYLRQNKEFCHIPPETTSIVFYAFQRWGQLLQTVLQHDEGQTGSWWDHRQRVDTPDGDFFHVDYKYQDEQASSQGMVVIVHGLQASSNSTSSIDMAQAFLNQGLDAACVNFRGCSGVPNDRLPAYHMGFTDDLIYFLELLNRNKAAPPLFLSGFSLGATVVLKCLGELGSRAPNDLNVKGAAVCCVPFDNERNVNFMQAPGFNRAVYNPFLLDSLKKTYVDQLERLPEAPEAEMVDSALLDQAKLVSDFDDVVIAPLFGFDDGIDYYRKTSCLNYLDTICVPTHVLHAADDPFFDPEVFPYDATTDARKDSPLKMTRAENGGHLGFLFYQGEDPRVDRQVSFFPSELARFIRHTFDEKHRINVLND